MGVGHQGLQFALLGRRRHVDFTRTLMVGRQNHCLDAGWVKLLFDRFGLTVSKTDAAAIVAEPYAEALLRALGAERADSVDASSYQDATIIHNLNETIPDQLKCKYSCVLEYGTLEHVFNFPIALKNIIDTIETGGHLLVVTPANNMMGHGFYQFSPELYYNFLSQNGFDQIEIYMIPYRWDSLLFQVSDPRSVRSRVELCNSEPMHLGVLARKAKHVSEMVYPVQSDYEQVWSGQDLAPPAAQAPAAPAPAANGPQPQPCLAAALARLPRIRFARTRARLANLISKPEPSLPQPTGFENSLHYRLIDPATD